MTEKPKSEGEYLTRLFCDLGEAGIRYCVMNNYQEMPEIIPTDVDIAIQAKSFGGLDRIVWRFAQKEGLVVVQKIWHGYQKCAYILSPPHLSERFRLQLDFFVDFTAKGYLKLISSAHMLTGTRPYKSFFVPCQDVELIFLLMRRVIKDDASAEKLAEIDRVVSENPSILRAVQEKFGNDIEKFCGDRLAVNVEQFRGSVESGRGFLKRYARGQSDLSYRFAYVAKTVSRLLCRIRYPVGLSVCFLSPDGGGKSATIRRVLELVGGSFHGERILYWRPRLLPPMGRLKFWNPSPEVTDNPNPHAHPPQSSLKSLVRFLYYLLDYCFGFLFIVQIATIRKKIVVFDRYYYDYLVDLHRYRMTLPRWLPRILLPLVPVPDVVIVLDCPVDVLLARKRELSAEELERQVKGYRALRTCVPNFYLVDASRNLDEVCQEVACVILREKAAITARAIRL